MRHQNLNEATKNKSFVPQPSVDVHLKSRSILNFYLLSYLKIFTCAFKLYILRLFEASHKTKLFLRRKQWLANLVSKSHCSILNFLKFKFQIPFPGWRFSQLVDVVVHSDISVKERSNKNTAVLVDEKGCNNPQYLVRNLKYATLDFHSMKTTMKFLIMTMPVYIRECNCVAKVD